MENKLKTLNEMNEVLSTVQSPFKEWDTWDYIRSHLRQSAINDIKEPHLEEYFLSGRTDLLPEFKEILSDGIKAYIKWKNNLTEKDLE